MNTEAVNLKAAVVTYSVTDAAIAQMNEDCKDLVITDVKSYRVVQKWITTYVTARTDVEKTRKVYNAEAIAYKLMVDTEAKRVTALMHKREEELKAMKKEFDDRKAAEQAEKERIEQERIDSIREKINNIGALVSEIYIKGTEELGLAIKSLSDMEITEKKYQEFCTEAEVLRSETLEILENRLAERLEHKKTQEALRKAEAEAAKLREQQEKIEIEAQAKRDAERAAKEEALRKLAKQEGEAKRKEENEAIRVILEAEAKEKAEREQKEKADREAAEKARLEKAEEERKASLPDREKLKLWLKLGIEAAIETAPAIETEAMKVVVAKALDDLYQAKDFIMFNIEE